MSANYDEIIKTYENGNIIQKIEIIGKPGLVPYLHHCVVIKNEREGTKTRIVFDASSKIGNNFSLNDCLHSGPCLLHLIFDIFLGVRIGDVGLVEDLKQAFLNIEIDEGDREF